MIIDFTKFKDNKTLMHMVLCGPSMIQGKIFRKDPTESLQIKGLTGSFHRGFPQSFPETSLTVHTVHIALECLIRKEQSVHLLKCYYLEIQPHFDI